jgi:hypothetical protein
VGDRYAEPIEKVCDLLFVGKCGLAWLPTVRMCLMMKKQLSFFCVLIGAMVGSLRAETCELCQAQFVPESLSAPTKTATTPKEAQSRTTPKAARSRLVTRRSSLPAMLPSDMPISSDMPTSSEDPGSVTPTSADESSAAVVVKAAADEQHAAVSVDDQDAVVVCPKCAKELYAAWSKEKVKLYKASGRIITKLLGDLQRTQHDLDAVSHSSAVADDEALIKVNQQEASGTQECETTRDQASAFRDLVMTKTAKHTKKQVQVLAKFQRAHIQNLQTAGCKQGRRLFKQLLALREALGKIGLGLEKLKTNHALAGQLLSTKDSDAKKLLARQKENLEKAKELAEHAQEVHAPMIAAQKSDLEHAAPAQL